MNTINDQKNFFNLLFNPNGENYFNMLISFASVNNFTIYRYKTIFRLIKEMHDKEDNYEKIMELGYDYFEMTADIMIEIYIKKKVKQCSDYEKRYITNE